MPSPHCAPLVALSPYTQATLALGQTRPPSSLDVPFLRAQLDRIEVTLSALLDQRLALTARLTEAVALTSPIRLLSTELLSAIFVACVESSERTSSQDAPVLVSTLMLVCKQWRDVCLGTPELWCRISISPNEPDSLDKARRRLIRSKAVALDVFLDFSPRSSYSIQASSTHQRFVSPDHLLKSALQLLRPTISRWRSFLLYVPYRPLATAALALCCSPAPLLESLSIQVTNPMLQTNNLDWDMDRSAKLSLPFKGVTPNLRACSLTSFWCERPEEHTVQTAIAVPEVNPLRRYDVTPPTFGWSRMVFPGVGPGLTRLRLIGFWNDFAPNVEETMSVLRQCPLLEDLYVRNVSDVDPADIDLNIPSKTPVVLSHLRQLSFYYSGVIRTCAILHGTVLPVLERLELAFLDNITACLKHLKEQTVLHHSSVYAYEYEYGYRNASETTYFPLKSLRIEASLFSELKFLRLLRRLPYLEKLELVDIEDVSGNLLKGMSGPIQGHEWILPRLNTLNLEGCTSFEWEDLKKFIERRLTSSSSSSSSSTTFHPQSKQLSSSREGKSMLSSSLNYARQAMVETPYRGAATLRQSTEARSCRVQKVRKLDLTKCTQISRERMQWLRMYVPELVFREETRP